MIDNRNEKVIMLVYGDIREMRWIAALLKTAFHGAILRQFSDAASALRYLETKTADVVLMETGLHAAGGELLYRLILERRPGLPVIAISENEHFAERDAAAKLRLPLNVEILTKTIQSVAAGNWIEVNYVEDSVW